MRVLQYAREAKGVNSKAGGGRRPRHRPRDRVAPFRLCYLAVVRQFFTFALPVALLAGCTQTPSYFPPCVNPYTTPCPLSEAGAPEDDAADVADAMMDGTYTSAEAADGTDAGADAE